MKKLIKVTSKEFNDVRSLDTSAIENVVKTGTRIRICTDRDPWYVVGTVDDQIKDKVTTMVVIKSWAKNRNYWTYKVEDIFNFMWELAYLDELYIDDKGNYFAKENKKCYQE